MPDNHPPGMPRPPRRTGRISPDLARLLAKYGASPSLQARISGDTGRPQPTGTDHGLWPPRPLHERLIRVAGADPDLLQTLPVERERYQMAGLVMLLRTVTITVVTAVALSGLGLPLPAAAVIAPLWAGITFTIDRWALTRPPAASKTREILRRLPRLALGALMAFVLAQGLALVLFAQVVDAYIATTPPVGPSTTILDRLRAWELASASNAVLWAANGAIWLTIFAVECMPVLTTVDLRARHNTYLTIIQAGPDPSPAETARRPAAHPYGTGERRPLTATGGIVIGSLPGGKPSQAAGDNSTGGGDDDDDNEEDDDDSAW